MIPAHSAHKWLMPAAVALLLSGCGGQELYTKLSERQANEMVAVLQSAGIAAGKSTKDGAVWVVSAPEAKFARAIETLHANGYPREEFETLGKVFKKEGFVSSPLEERARLNFGLTQELSNTLSSSIDGVISARVHLAVPEKDPLAEKARPASASIVIKHRPGVDLSGLRDQIRAVVVTAVEGLPYDNVTVALFPAQQWPAGAGAKAINSEMTATPWVAAGGAGLVGALGAGVWLGWRRRNRSGGAVTVAAHTQPVKPDDA
jgi:type III secretion protein J